MDSPPPRSAPAPPASSADRLPVPPRSPPPVPASYYDFPDTTPAAAVRAPLPPLPSAEYDLPAAGAPSDAAAEALDEEGARNRAAVAEIAALLQAAMQRDPSGQDPDSGVQVLLERLNNELAKYSDELPGDEEGDAEARAREDELALAEEEGAGFGAGSSGRRAAASASRPRPVDLWNAAHASHDGPKEAVRLTYEETQSMVKRLNENARAKQEALSRMIQARDAEELSGFTFTPAISERSRALAAHNKSLPQRVDALVKKQNEKLSKIRQERSERELAEATFKPDLGKTRAAREALDSKERRQIGHLLQYEIDKRTRAMQRRQLIQEMENRELRFAPTINKNSARIVERLNREREERMAATTGREGADGGAPASPSVLNPRSARKVLTAALAAGLPLEAAVAAAGVPETEVKTLKAFGRSLLPGHEEETFHPRINPRSAAISRGAAHDANVYSRLYTQTTLARQNKARPNSSKSPRRVAGLDTSMSSTDRAALADAENEVTQYPTDEAGQPAPGHPHYFNVIAFEPSARMDLLLHRLLPSAVGDTSMDGSTM